MQIIQRIVFPRLPFEPRVSSCTGCVLPAATMPSFAMCLRVSMLKIYGYTDIPSKKKTFGLRINRCSGLTSAGFLTFPTVVANLNTYLSTSIVCRGDVTTVLWSTSTFAFGSARMLCPWPTLATLVIRCNQYAANHHNHHNIHRVAIAQQLWDFQFAQPCKNRFTQMKSHLPGSVLLGHSNMFE